MYKRQTKMQKYLKKQKQKRKKKPFHYRNGAYHRFKWPGAIIAGVFLSLVIILPAVIVMIPKASDSATENEAVTVSSKEEMDDDAIEVAVKRSGDGEVENVPLEEYVTSVVASEMPAEFEKEALKAQAIAARTYVVNHLGRSEGEDAVITDDTDDQVYLNEEELKRNWGKEFHWKMEKVAEAVAETKNEIITYDAEPITPTFFSMSNGYTEDAENYWGDELPYLKSVESKWEETNPKFTEQKIFNTQEIADKTGVSLSPGAAVPIEISRTPSNRVETINFNNQEFSGKEMREKLDLRSNDFTVTQKDDHFIFTTKGFGHGVGMSQYGANGMAEEGRSYEEIIQHYYQGVELQKINDAVPALVAK